MFDPISAIELAIIRYHEMLRRAEAYRLIRKLRTNQPGFLAGNISGFGTTLGGTGRKPRAHDVPKRIKRA
jgi:hypothetical protein